MFLESCPTCSIPASHVLILAHAGGFGLGFLQVLHWTPLTFLSPTRMLPRRFGQRANDQLSPLLRVAHRGKPKLSVSAAEPRGIAVIGPPDRRPGRTPCSPPSRTLSSRGRFRCHLPASPGRHRHPPPEGVAMNRLGTVVLLVTIACSAAGVRPAAAQAADSTTAAAADSGTATAPAQSADSAAPAA